MSKSYTLDKLNEALEAVRRGDDAAAQGAILELIDRMEIMMRPYDPKPLEELYKETYDLNFDTQKESHDGTDTQTERETP